MTPDILFCVKTFFLSELDFVIVIIWPVVMVNSCSSFQQLSPTMIPTLTTACVALMVSPDHHTSLSNKLAGVIPPSPEWCLFLPADLIMLGLATHEPNFTIIREEFKPNKPRPCALCGQMGHELKECQGTAREKQGQVGPMGSFLTV